MSSHEPFLVKLRSAIQSGAFVKLTLSQYRGKEPGLKNIYVRRVELRDGPQLSFLSRYATRDITKNQPTAQGLEQLNELLAKDFGSAHLFTTTGDFQLRTHEGGSTSIKASRPAFQVAPQPEHDRQKPQPIAALAPFLQTLGVANALGHARPGMTDKLRQIQRFTEILGHLLDQTPRLKSGGENRPLKVVDMGAGKGYLTFATYEFLNQRGFLAEVTGVEIRPDLVTLTNQAARELQFERLQFVPGTISNFAAPPGIDVLIALHACDTATDDAIHQGIRAGAALIVTAPCCHKEVRRQLQVPEVLQDVFKHGILSERQAESITDAIRALILEIHGYQASVFEFISNEHTGKNLMIAASKRSQPLPAEPLRKRLAELLAFFSIADQRLARLLGELPAEAPGHN